MSQQQRQEVVEQARKWIDTPFHNNQRKLGVGVDCANLPAACVGAALGIELSVPVYHYQWHLHADPKTGIFHELYLETLVDEGFVEISDGRKIDWFQCDQCRAGAAHPGHAVEASKGPGDIVVARIGRTYCHGGIIVDWPAVIHAEGNMQRHGPMKRPGAVRCIESATSNGYYQGRRLRFFSRREWHA
jgi:hypothetical protein